MIMKRILLATNMLAWFFSNTTHSKANYSLYATLLSDFSLDANRIRKDVCLTLCWGLTTHQLLWVVLCRLTEKGREEMEEMLEEMKERNKNERGTGMKVKKTEEIKTFPSTLTCYKDSKLAHLLANISWTPRWRKMHDTFATPDHPPRCLLKTNKIL